MESLILTGTVGRGGANVARDVTSVQKRLQVVDRRFSPARSGVCGDDTIQAITSFQLRFLGKPDGLIQVQGMTLRFLSRWAIKPIGKNVDLRGNLQIAWDLLNPLLPAGSYCASGYRSAEDQRRILHCFFTETYKPLIINKYGAKAWQDAWDKRATSDEKILGMVRGVGQAIAPPGKSMHERGKAIDIGGPDEIEQEQVRVVKLVAKANSTLFNGTILKERSGCVHVEIR